MRSQLIWILASAFASITALGVSTSKAIAGSACSLCSTCGGDWPISSGFISLPSGSKPRERGWNCSGDPEIRTDSSPRLCCAEMGYAPVKEYAPRNWRWSRARKYRRQGDSVKLFAPIQLPDGAMVDQVGCHFHDSSTTSELAIGLYQITWGGNRNNFTNCGIYRSGVAATTGWTQQRAVIANNTSCRQAVDGDPKPVANIHKQGTGTLSYLAMLEIPDPAPGTNVEVATCSARFNTGGEHMYYNLSHFAFQPHDLPFACRQDQRWCPRLNKCVPQCNSNLCERLSDDGAKCIYYCSGSRTCSNGKCCVRGSCQSYLFPDPCH